MTVYPDSIKLEVELSAGVRTDISQYVSSAQDADYDISWGLPGANPVTDLVATTGTLKVVLLNSTGYFTPKGPSMLTGWKTGIKAYFTITYLTKEFVRFYGTVSDIMFDAVRYGSKVPIVITDWMEYAANYPMQNAALYLNGTSKNGVDTILSSMPVPPIASNIQAGKNVYPVLFSAVKSKTRAVSEISKVVSSEWSRFYIRKPRTTGEEAVLENLDSRSGLRQLDKVLTVSGKIRKAGSADFIRKAGSATDKLLLVSGDDIFINDIAIEGSVKVSSGKNVINHIEVSASPSRVDTSDNILFKLNEPLAIASGQTVHIKGGFVNPSGGGRINGTSMITPVVTTDYQAWTNKDATGTDFSASIVVTPSYVSEGFDHAVYNGSSNNGYITKFNCRGRGIYFENDIRSVIENTESIETNRKGEVSSSISMKYQRDLSYGEPIAKSIVGIEKDEDARIEELTFIANDSDTSMNYLLYIDVGYLIRVKSTLAGLDDWYFVTSVNIKVVKKIIRVKIALQKHWSIASGDLTPISIEYAGESYTQGVNFGHIPALADLPERTMCTWIKPVGETPNIQNNMVCGMFADGSAYELQTSFADQSVMFFQKYSGAGGGQQVWKTPTASFVTGSWHHILVLSTLSLLSPPQIFIDGVSQVLTKVYVDPPNTTAYSDKGVPFIIGNVRTATLNYTWGYPGIIKDTRVYGRFLSTAEITTLYNGGTPSVSLVTSGLLFQAPVVKTSEAADYIGSLSGKKVYDNINRYVGEIIGAPTGGAF